jgi:hypothetical protein
MGVMWRAVSVKGCFFVSDGVWRGITVSCVVCVVFLERVARKLSEGLNSNYRKLGLAVCTVCYGYGSTDLMGELGFVGKRWPVLIV